MKCYKDLAMTEECTKDGDLVAAVRFEDGSVATQENTSSRPTYIKDDNTARFAPPEPQSPRVCGRCGADESQGEQCTCVFP